MVVVCIIIVVVLLLIFFFNPKSNQIRWLNEIVNNDITVVDFINTLNGWNMTTQKVDGVRLVIFPKDAPTYYMYLTYCSKAPSLNQLSNLRYELLNDKSKVQIAHILNMTYGNFVKYEKGYNEHQVLMQKYGLESKAANDYFTTFFKTIREFGTPNEWRRYQNYRWEESKKETAKLFDRYLG